MRLRPLVAFALLALPALAKDSAVGCPRSWSMRFLRAALEPGEESEALKALKALKKPLAPHVAPP